MKNRLFILTLLAMLAFSAELLAEGKWMTRATMQIGEPGLIETVVPPELHRTPQGKVTQSAIDLSLIGPDGNFRAFELFWRAAGEGKTVKLEAEKTTLLEDRRILWEASLAKGFSYSSLKVTIAGGNYAGKVDFEGMLNGKWSVLATGTPLAPQMSGDAAIVFPAAQYEKIRCYFTGFDEYFKQTPVFVESVETTAKLIGSDFARSVLTPQIEQTPIENGVEARIFLPGSGLRIDTIELFTSAQFVGQWQIGRENIILGKREFQPVDGGVVTAIGNERQKLVISQARLWDKRVLLVRMRSDNFFGKIEQVKVNVLLPRMMFVADKAGEYSLQTGHDRGVNVLEKPETENGTSARMLDFAAVTDNSEWQAESMLKSYSAKGGPFKVADYKWQSAVAIEKPGFYQLLTTDKINLDRYRDALRIVKDETQIPFFLGGEELRELDLKVETSYEAANNRTVYLIKLPENSARLKALRFKAKGIFNRTLKFEKHEPGQISWQQWQSRNWVNQNEAETAFTLGLSSFPEDQYEIRMIIDHASNQPIEIAEFKGLYTAQDLLFIANQPGTYYLMGGNSTARAPVYDLAMVEDSLSELAPVKVQPGIWENIDAQAVDVAGPVDQGAPFNDAGYSWVATFSVPATGFYQLGLNLKAALDANPSGFRLVRNGLQVPYFFGSLSESSLAPKFTAEYNRDDNTTVCVVELPVASKQWQSLQFTSAGVFSRNLTLEIRKPGKLGWKTFATSIWTSRSDGLTTQAMRLDRLPEGDKELRLVIPHGDNSPISITAVKAYYQSQSMLFQANDAGEYQLYGGNSAAKTPRYDLALIKDNMLKKEPQRLQLGESAEFSGASQVGRQLGEAFSDRGWGIYAVLGLVTALLLLIIVKLFPEDKKPDQPPAE